MGRLTGFIELKADDGRPSAEQLVVEAIMVARGIPYAMTYGRDQPIKILELWGAVRPQISQINSTKQGEALHSQAWSGEAKLGGARRGAAKQGKDVAA